MPILAVDGAVGAGGAVYTSTGIGGGTTPDLRGKKFLLVGDWAMCPGHSSPQKSTIVSGDTKMKIKGIAVAIVGSATDCGHPIASSPNSTDFQL